MVFCVLINLSIKYYGLFQVLWKREHIVSQVAKLLWKLLIKKNSVSLSFKRYVGQSLKNWSKLPGLSLSSLWCYWNAAISRPRLPGRLVSDHLLKLQDFHIIAASYLGQQLYVPLLFKPSRKRFRVFQASWELSGNKFLLASTLPQTVTTPNHHELTEIDSAEFRKIAWIPNFSNS